jgi:ascorbate PTS system EIIA or EIIAB component
MAGLNPTDDAAGRAVLAARVRCAAEDWREAVRTTLRPPVDAEAVTPGYVDQCVALVEEHGPYIVLAPGIALAHARPEDGVRRLAIAAVTLAAPVEFGHADNDPVDVVFAFGSPDADQHVGLLSQLARHLGTGLADRLRAAEDDPSAQNLLEEIADER